MISNRHIRHDFNTWVDWEQKTVRSLCGITTRRHLAGIPGITDQPSVVNINGKEKAGWCKRCCYVGYYATLPIVDQVNKNSHIEKLYLSFLLITKPAAIVIRYRLNGSRAS